MIILILTAILALGAFWLVFREMVLDYYPAPVMGTILATLAGGVVVGLGFGASAIVTYNTTDLTPVLTREVPLRALGTGSDTRGSFTGSVFIAHGHFESGPAYTYLTVRDDGGFEMDATATSNAIVYQTNEVEPHAVFGQVRPTSTLWSILPLPAKAEFYVPVGSVQDPQFRVDTDRGESR